MDIEKAKRVEKLLEMIDRCDRLLNIWNNTVDDTEIATFPCGFSLQFSTSLNPTLMKENIPEELNGRIIDLIIIAKNEFEMELEMM